MRPLMCRALAVTAAAFAVVLLAASPAAANPKPNCYGPVGLRPARTRTPVTPS